MIFHTENEVMCNSTAAVVKFLKRSRQRKVPCFMNPGTYKRARVNEELQLCRAKIQGFLGSAG